MLDKQLQEVYDKLLELTDGEEDEELKQYNDYLLGTVEIARNIIGGVIFVPPEYVSRKFLRVVIDMYLMADLEKLAKENDCEVGQFVYDILTDFVSNSPK